MVEEPRWITKSKGTTYRAWLCRCGRLGRQPQHGCPTTSRLSRSFLLSTASILQWGVWTADVQTAFLQGTPQQRELWVQLPAESLRVLGAPPETRMKLIKPVYGQLDAPRKWYLEAVRRLKSLGFRQHCLDPCCFLLYETDHKDCSGDGTPTDHLLGPEKLCCIICLHVDDMLGAGSENSATYCRVRTELRELFNFREWQTDKELTYCGATLQREDSTWMVNHSTYLSKVKPITVAKRGPEAELSPAEVSRLRGLLGSLQWPAVQSQPHLCCSASLIAGQMHRSEQTVAVCQGQQRCLPSLQQHLPSRQAEDGWYV